jgi:hypothetical protein
VSVIVVVNVFMSNDYVYSPNERYGTLAYYDKAYDRANTRVERELMRSNGTYYTVSTCEDPVIERLARENAGLWNIN